LKRIAGIGGFCPLRRGDASDVRAVPDIHRFSSQPGGGIARTPLKKCAMSDDQLGFDLGESRRPAGVYFAPEDIREDARALIAQARAVTADTPWDAGTLKYHRIAFPHLVSWLPDADERAQLCLEFTGEADRIERLLAA
jgi:hypothetical protein